MKLSRTVGYALPAVLHTHIQTVAPTTYFPSTRMPRQTPRRRSFGEATAQSGKLVAVLSSRDGDFTWPSNLRSQYKTFAYEPVATDKNKLGVVGFVNEYPSQADLTRFMTDFSSDAEDAIFTVEQVNGGGNDQRKPGKEANADVQYAGAMAYPTPLIFYSIGGIAHWGPTGRPVPGRDMYLEWFKYLLDQPNIPQTISISYANYEKDFPPQYMTALCDLFGQLGARGVSVLFPSGDTGVGLPGDCKDGSGNVRFIPEFPPSCTWGVL